MQDGQTDEYGDTLMMTAEIHTFAPEHPSMTSPPVKSSVSLVEHPCEIYCMKLKGRFTQIKKKAIIINFNE